MSNLFRYLFRESCRFALYLFAFVSVVVFASNTITSNTKNNSLPFSTGELKTEHFNFMKVHWGNIIDAPECEDRQILTFLDGQPICGDLPDSAGRLPILIAEGSNVFRKKVDFPEGWKAWIKADVDIGGSHEVFRILGTDKQVLWIENHNNGGGCGYNDNPDRRFSAIHGRDQNIPRGTSVNLIADAIPEYVEFNYCNEGTGDNPVRVHNFEVWALPPGTVDYPSHSDFDWEILKISLDADAQVIGSGYISFD